MLKLSTVKEAHLLLRIAQLLPQSTSLPGNLLIPYVPLEVAGNINLPTIPNFLGEGKVRGQRLSGVSGPLLDSQLESLLPSRWANLLTGGLLNSSPCLGSSGVPKLQISLVRELLAFIGSVLKFGLDA